MSNRELWISLWQEAQVFSLKFCLLVLHVLTTQAIPEVSCYLKTEMIFIPLKIIFLMLNWINFISVLDLFARADEIFLSCTNEIFLSFPRTFYTKSWVIRKILAVEKLKQWKKNILEYQELKNILILCLTCEAGWF